jgi:hypothetical protein
MIIAPLSSAKGPAMRTVPSLCSLASRLRCSARAVRRSGSPVKVPHDPHAGTVCRRCHGRLYQLIHDLVGFHPGVAGAAKHCAGHGRCRGARLPVAVRQIEADFGPARARRTIGPYAIRTRQLVRKRAWTKALTIRWDGDRVPPREGRLRSGSVRRGRPWLLR